MHLDECQYFESRLKNSFWENFGPFIVRSVDFAGIRIQKYKYVYLYIALNIFVQIDLLIVLRAVDLSRFLRCQLTPVYKRLFHLYLLHTQQTNKRNAILQFAKTKR